MVITKQTVKEKVNEQIARLETGVEDLCANGDLANYLRTVAKFYNYSMFNQLLIWTQNKDATHVAGFRAWEDKFNRYIQKGEKGIAILFPRFVKKEDRQDDDKPEPIGFGVGYVFDVSQTEGDPMPERPNWPELTSTTSNGQALLSLGCKLTEKYDLTIKFEQPSVKGARGSFHIINNVITIDDTLSVDQQAQVLMHELGHWKLRHQNESYIDLEYELEEVVVDSTAFVVCAYFDLDTAEQDFYYVTNWANADIDVVKSQLRPISKLSRELINDLESEVTI